MQPDTAGIAFWKHTYLKENKQAYDSKTKNKYTKKPFTSSIETSSKNTQNNTTPSGNRANWIKRGAIGFPCLPNNPSKTNDRGAVFIVLCYLLPWVP